MTNTLTQLISFWKTTKRNVLLAAMMAATISANAQTQLIPTSEGGFENATSTFAANNWTPVLPGIARQWQVGTPAGSVSGGTKSAYVGNATTYNGTGALQVGHFFRDISIPAGATAVTLTFSHRVPTIDNTFDYFRVFTTTTANTPVSGTSPGAGYTQQFQNTATAYAAFTAMAPIDLTALAGTTVRLVFTNVSDGVTPHANFAVDNISLVYTPGTGCSGTPTGGTTLSSANPVCSGSSFTLSLSGATTLSGITYQWQSSADNITYANIGGATSASYAATQTTATYYRCFLTCTNGGLTATSTPLQVTMSPLINCYCPPVYTSGCGVDYISNVTFGTINNTTTCTGITPSNLTQYTSPNPVFYRGFSYPMSVTTDGDVEGLRVWIDYDQSLTWISGESVLIGTAGGPPQTTSGTVLIPLTASLGQTVMRVRCRYNANLGGGGACNSFDYGETEDYLITIADAPICGGTSNAGTATASINPVCAGTTVNFSLTGASVEAGLTYQWQSSPDDITYTNISGATSSTYSAPVSNDVWGRCYVTCTGSGLSSASISIHMTISPFYNCYCEPSYGNDCSIDYISNVTFNGINNTTTCSGTTPSNLTTYNTPNPTLSQGTTYPISITTDGDVEGLGVWIDYNQNGVFDANATEFILSAAAGGPPQTTTANITIPTGIPSGITKMRVRCRYNNAVANTAACTAFGSGFGETEDYLITIGPQICIAAPTAPANAAGVCPGDFTDLSWPSLSGATGYDVYFDTNPTPTTLVSANQPGTTYTPGTLTEGATYYWSIVPIMPGGATSCQIWNFNIKPNPDPIASSNSPVCDGVTISFSADNNAAGQSTGNSYQWSGPSFSSTQQNPSIPSSTAANNGSYTVIVTNQYLCTATSAPVTVNVNSNPSASIASQTNVSCNGLADGVVDINATGGFPNPDYLFTDGSAFNIDGIFTGYSAGPYTITVTDDLGCSSDIIVTITEPDVLVAAASSNSPICEGSNLNFTSSAIGGTTSYSYSWTGPNTYAASIDNPIIVSATPAESGTYTVTVTDAHGCTDNETVSVTVVAAATPNAGPDQTICAGTPITIIGPFDGNSSNTSVWSTNGDGTFNYPNTLTAVYTPGSNDISNGTVVLTVTTLPNGPCGSASDNMTVTINNVPASPGIVTGMPSTICPPVSGINLSINPVATATSYNWAISPGTSGVTFTTPTNGTSVSLDLALVTNNTYTVRVYALNGCGSSIGYSTTNTRRAVSTPLNPAGPTAACANDVKTYTIPSVTGADSYTWSGPTGALIDGNPTPYTANVTSVNVTFPAGFINGTVCVAANVACFTTVNKCTSVSSGTASVGSISGNATVCPGNSYTYSVVPVAGAATYNWVLPPNVSGSSSTNSINVTIGSAFSSADIKVSVTTACGITSSQKAKTITTGVPQRPASITGPANGLCGQNAVYSCPSQSGVTFAWTVPSGSTVNSGQGTNAINATFGTFTSGTVCVNASNSCGSSADRCITAKGAPATPSAITVNPSSWCANTAGITFTANLSNLTGSYTLSWIYPAPSVATYVIGGGNSTSLTLDWISGSGNVIVTAANACGNGSRILNASSTCRDGGAEIGSETNTFVVAPNPAHDFIKVTYTSELAGKAIFVITDISGRILMNNSAVSQSGFNQISLDVKSLAKGVYIISMENNNDVRQSRIVIE